MHEVRVVDVAERDGRDVVIACDLRAPGTPLPHVWEHTIGSGHAPLALRADYQGQLKRCQEELGIQHVRFHGLLCDDVGTLVCVKDQLLYSFFNADAIWDGLLANGVRPFVELSFMPATLASGSDTVFHYAGRINPPKNYGTWGDLVRRLVAHAVERYGRDEVARWFFEVWNEPNLSAFWTGTQADYFRLYQESAQAVKAIDAAFHVGGPVTANNAWIAEFVEFCDRTHTPLDFVSTHQYPTDAFGKPDDDTKTQLAASHRSILRDRARATHGLTRGRPLYYTEWSTSSNPRDPLHDEPYAAPVIVKTMLEARGLTSGYSWWTFSDIFEENYFPSEPFHGGFGLLTLYGVPKPSYHAFALLHRLGTDLVHAVEDRHPTIDAWVVKRGSTAATVIITNHALPRHRISTERVRVALCGTGRPTAVMIWRIDKHHGNPKARWQALGRPGYLNREQVNDLLEHSRLAPEPQSWTYNEQQLQFDVEMPPHSVASITIDLTPSPAESVHEAPTACT